MIIELEVAGPHAEHARLIMEWRNDPQTLRMFYHGAPKKWPGFLEEYTRDYFLEPSLPPLFACADGDRIGFLRLQPARDPRGSGRRCCDISINLNPEARGKGLSVPILRVAALFARRQGWPVMLAEVKEANIIAQGMFLGAGFVRVDACEKRVMDTGEHVPILRYVLDVPVHETSSDPLGAVTSRETSFTNAGRQSLA